MSYGHGPHGVVRITMKPSALKKLAYSWHTSSQIVHDLTDMSEDHRVAYVTTHKEEKPSCIRSKEEDRERIREKPQSCIDPLDPADHPDRVTNIVTDRIGPEKMNAPNAVEIGRTQMRSYEES